VGSESRSVMLWPYDDSSARVSRSQVCILPTWCLVVPALHGQFAPILQCGVKCACVV